ncbi:alkali metal cation/H+ antiporter Nha1 C terminus-domain-containing protein [Xylogone sp. PMI_703]|nr:alkali metal cation/H+ antiporter Nha1 C terminus-domain-containing protein [Xylogone sp. PMI_703]
MAWEHLAINRPHLVYIILGGFTSLFMLCSSFIKERLYIGEATVATICGIIFGPHAANLINPLSWGNTDQITLEFSRIVLVVQCFAVGVELPKYYMEKHWRSVVFLLIPVMTYGWLVTSLFIWWMITPLSWLESLCCAACVTATDPVLASSVVGKGKFAKRVPKHLRDLLSAESGCNDGMAFPFIYLALYLIHYNLKAKEVTYHWIVYTILYECIFGAVYGFIIGYIGRHGIKYAEKHDLVDRESFLVFYFVLALFCAGSGSILGVDDLLVGFTAGVGFSNDGWFTQKTEESHVSNVIDLLLNLAYFVYLGTIIPWEQYNNTSIGISPWRLVVIAIFVIFFRRIPIMMLLKPLIPDIKSWREALFAGHFGPIGVGAIFVAILARADLETDGGPTPLASYPNPNAPNFTLVALIWPITTFLVISSIVVHGSSIAVFTLGKHINTLTLTMSYTTAGEEGPSWMNRLPRISSQSRSQAKSVTSETDADDLKNLPPGVLPPIGIPGNFLRRQREEDTQPRNGSRPSSIHARRRKKRWDSGLGPGGPISESAIYPQRRTNSELTSDTLTPGESSPEDEKETEDHPHERPIGEVQDDREMRKILHQRDAAERPQQHMSDAERSPGRVEVYEEGDDIVIEDEDGDVLATEKTPEGEQRQKEIEKLRHELKEDLENPGLGYKHLRKKVSAWRHRDEGAEAPSSKAKEKKRGPALAYQFGNTIIVEDEDGEVVKKYELPSRSAAAKAVKEGTEEQPAEGRPMWVGLRSKSQQQQQQPQAESSQKPEESGIEAAVIQGIKRMGTWSGFGLGRTGGQADSNPKENEEDDDRRIRFMIGGGGRRLTKDDFLKEIQNLDPKARSELLQKNEDASMSRPPMGRQTSSRYQSQTQTQTQTRAQDDTAGTGEEDDDTKVDKPSSSSSSEERGRRRDSITAVHVVDRDPQTRKTRLQPIATSEATSIQETPAERRRRELALKGVDDPTSPDSEPRGRSLFKEESTTSGEEKETAAEKRRREAALGMGGATQDDSDDDDTPRVPPPVVKSRGIRFAQSPVRRK